jgi:L-lactate permease
MQNSQRPVDLLHWTLALLPIVVLLVLLRWKAPQAGPMGMFTAAAVALLLSVAAIGVLAIEPVNNALEAFSIGLPFPAVATGSGIANEAADPYSPFAPLTHPGTFLLVTWVVYRARGYYREWSSGENKSILRGLIEDAVPASVPVIAFLVMAQLMNHSGQNDVLALGIATVAPTYEFAFLSNGIGTLGAFMTSSSTSSNVLFSDLQHTVARLKGLPEATIIAAQSAAVTCAATVVLVMLTGAGVRLLRPLTRRRSRLPPSRSWPGCAALGSTGHRAGLQGRSCGETPLGADFRSGRCGRVFARGASGSTGCQR